MTWLWRPHLAGAFLYATKIQVYPSIINYKFCTFDNQGDLFILGTSPSRAVLAELPKGSSTFVDIAVNAVVRAPAQVQWDGQYLALAELGNRVLYRLSVSGSTARVVSMG